jgi:hypothetical protein
MAYWQIQKTSNTSRWLQSRPATLRDLYDILLTSNNKAPRELFEKPKTGIDPTMRKHWNKQTDSTHSAISWWTG